MSKTATTAASSARSPKPATRRRGRFWSSSANIPRNSLRSVRTLTRHVRKPVSKNRETQRDNSAGPVLAGAPSPGQFTPSCLCGCDAESGISAAVVFHYYFFGRRPPPPIPMIRAVAALCVAVTIKQDISAPYGKIHRGVSMEECYRLLGDDDGSGELATSGNAIWDDGAIRIWYSPGSSVRPSEQKVTWISVRRDYNGARWFRYSLKKRYSGFIDACERAQLLRKWPGMLCHAAAVF